MIRDVFEKCVAIRRINEKEKKQKKKLSNEFRARTNMYYSPGD